MNTNIVMDMGARLRIMGSDIAHVIDNAEMSVGIGRQLAEGRGISQDPKLIAAHFKAGMARFEHAADLGAILLGDSDATLVDVLHRAAGAAEQAQLLAAEGRASFAGITDDLVEAASHDVLAPHISYLRSGDVQEMMAALR